MKFGKLFVACSVLALLCFASAPLSAEDKPWVIYPIEKLSRGVANVAFGVLEIPMKWYDVNTEMGGIAGLTYGSIKGVFWFIAREVVGVVDIITFPVPLPGCHDDPNGYGWGYGPLMTPPWVVDVEHDWNNFIYHGETVASPAY
ncbi:MAG: exosortase system-associated protein, TIGR04073 family [Victivallaceae bacterium]|nr:exosortase system-associated protein, TIGR04073 family [Victivallaceae bacterium]